MFQKVPFTLVLFMEIYIALKHPELNYLSYIIFTHGFDPPFPQKLSVLIEASLKVAVNIV